MKLTYRYLNKMMFILLLISINCTAKIVENLKYEYYPVDINANQTYHRATANSSPFKSHDSVAIGLHHLKLEWQWTPSTIRENHRCKVTDFIVYHNTLIHLPKLVSSADEKQAREFHYYAELIHQHELEHYYIAKGYVQRFEHKVIRELGSFKDCSQIKQHIQTIYDNVMIDYKQQQDEFDLRDRQISKIEQIHRLLYG